MFQDRVHAARILAERLLPYRGRNPLVLGVPRGGVPMAQVVAEALNGDLDVVLVRKLRSPGHLELAIGSVSEGGDVFVLPVARELLVSEEYIRQETEIQLEELRRRRSLYASGRVPTDPKERVVIVVDDGIATGATFVAALRAVRARKPARLVAAAAVASPQAARRIAPEADELVCLEVPEYFYAVGHHFKDFAQVTDEAVSEILRGAVPAPAASGRGAGHA